MSKFVEDAIRLQELNQELKDIEAGEFSPAATEMHNRLKEKMQAALDIALSDMILRFEDGLTEEDIQDLIEASTEEELDNYIFSAI